MSSNAPTLIDKWTALRAYTPARIGLPRAGAAVATRETLAFQLAHALARDAVHDALDPGPLAAALAARSLASLQVHSAAPDRERYLLRPDLGRRLDEASAAALARQAGGCDLAIVIADGLSARAAATHAPALVDALWAKLRGFTIAPIVIAEQARVALGDEIGALLRARLVVVLIGERPGLTAPDSLGAYLTFAPRLGRTDAERNCLSNIRPEGMSYAEAARRLAFLCGEALRLGLSGVGLKDETDSPLLR